MRDISGIIGIFDGGRSDWWSGHVREGESFAACPPARLGLSTDGRPIICQFLFWPISPISARLRPKKKDGKKFVSCWIPAKIPD